MKSRSDANLVQAHPELQGCYHILPTRWKLGTPSDGACLNGAGQTDSCRPLCLSLTPSLYDELTGTDYSENLGGLVPLEIPEPKASLYIQTKAEILLKSSVGSSLPKR